MIILKLIISAERLDPDGPQKDSNSAPKRLRVVSSSTPKTPLCLPIFLRNI